jgi:4-amino-4-deoxy-L-arabinose transferase-like glycosyltransferase
LLSSLVKARRWEWRASASAQDRFHLFTLAWLVVPIAFFSVSGSKLPGYILPALPAAALLSGEQLSRVARGEGRALSIRVTGLLLIALACAGVLYARRTGYTSIACASLVLGPLFIAGLLAVILTHLRRLCLILTAGAMFLAIALATGCVGGAIARRESTRELLREAAARGLARAPVCGLYVIERTAEFYAGERVMREPNGEVVRFEGATQVLEAAGRSGGSILVFVPVEAVNQLTEYPSVATEIIGDNGTVALVAVRAR